MGKNRFGTKRRTSIKRDRRRARQQLADGQHESGPSPRRGFKNDEYSFIPSRARRPAGSNPIRKKGPYR